jgi:FMN phosphatase YigB (HAD superfamily)
MSQIKFVYFDIGDVVFEWKQVLRKIAAMANKSYEEVYAVYKKYDDDVCRGKISPQELWQHFKIELGIDKEIENFIEWWVSDFTPILPMHQLAKEIAKRYEVGILTNIYPGAWKYYVAKGLIPDVSYVAIIRSCDLGFVKPEPEIFKYAEDKAGILASEILLIDNSQKNIDKAKSLGWQVVWYDVNSPQKSIAEIKRVLELE